MEETVVKKLELKQQCATFYLVTLVQQEQSSMSSSHSEN